MAQSCGLGTFLLDSTGLDSGHTDINYSYLFIQTRVIGCTPGLFQRGWSGRYMAVLGLSVFSGLSET